MIRLLFPPAIDVLSVSLQEIASFLLPPRCVNLDRLAAIESFEEQRFQPCFRFALLILPNERPDIIAGRSVGLTLLYLFLDESFHALRQGNIKRGHTIDNDFPLRSL